MASATTDRRLGLTSDKGIKAPVTVATTANITLSGEQTIDGVAVKAVNAGGFSDRVLVKNQTNQVDNGIWDVSTGQWTRSLDSNGNQDLVTGTSFVVASGGQAGQFFSITSANPIVIGTSAITFSTPNPQISSLATQSGASLIGWIRGLTGAIAYTVGDWLGWQKPNALEFMTIAQRADVLSFSGSIDVTAALNAAHAASRGVHYPYGKYKATSQLNVIWSDAIDITADQGAVIDCSTSTDPFGMFVGGTAVPAGGVADLYNRATRAGGQALSADVSRGGRSITVSGLGLVAGDVIRVSSSVLFSASYSVAYKGELCEVASVSGSPLQTAVLTDQLMDSYTAATTTIFKIGSPKVTIKNLKILRNGNYTGLSVWEARNVDISNVEVSGTANNGLQMAYCFGGQVRDCYVRNAYVGGVGNGYALAVSTCQNLTITGGQYLEGRLGVSVGGYEPARFITFNGGMYACVNSGTAPVGFDTHGNCEYVTINGVHIKGGACLSGRNLIFNKNTVQQDQAGFPVQVFYQTDSDYTILDGNTVRSTGGYGHFYFEVEQANKTAKSIICKNNVSVGAISNVHGGYYFAPFNASGTNFRVNHLALIDNHVDASGSTAGVGIFINEGLNGAAVGDKWVVDSMLIRGGYYSAFQVLALAPFSPSGDLVIDGGRYISNRATASLGGAIDNFADVKITGGAYFEEKGSGTNQRWTPVTRIDINDITLKGFAASGGLTLDTGTYEWKMKDINQVSCTGTITNNNSAANGIAIAMTGFSKTTTPAPVRLFWATATPTGGAYLQGDVWLNANATSGAKMGEMCTVAGTPGTWKSMGNLA